MGVLYARVGGAWVPISGGSSGTDEVFVGTDDPIATNSAVELWVDTDEPNVMTDDMRWNTAWGIVAVGSFKASAMGTIIASGSVITDPLVFTSVSGRRYRVRCTVRAVEAGGAVASGMFSEIRKNGAAVGDQHHPSWAVVNTAYAASTIEVLFTGDGTTATWDVDIRTMGTSSTTFRAYPDQLSSNFFIEDVGPVSAATPAINPTPAWIALTPLTNGWVAGNPAPAYRKLGDMVQFKGNINRTTALVAPTTSYFGTLPVGYRPPIAINPPCMSVGSDNWGAASILVVATNGDVAVVKTAQSPSNPHSGTQWEFQFSVTP